MTRFQKALTWLIAFLIPFFLIMSSIRILINPWYLDYQYNKPGFPEDVYGFTREDRLHWGKISLEYLVNNADPSFLGELRLADGSPLYNTRELSHMVDVKAVVQGMLTAWYILGGLLLAGTFALWRTKQLRVLWYALSRGGWITIGIIVTILVSMMINFDALFSVFHSIFFKGDSWLFSYSDTLIRLFPIPLWEEAFIWMGIFTTILALTCGFGGKKLAVTAK
jgi:integral membrane protein (TIGR01906 family)